MRGTALRGSRRPLLASCRFLRFDPLVVVLRPGSAQQVPVAKRSDDVIALRVNANPTSRRALLKALERHRCLADRLLVCDRCHRGSVRPCSRRNRGQRFSGVSGLIEFAVPA